FTVTSIRTTNDDIIKDWTEIRLLTTELLKELNIRIADRAKVPLKDTREKNEAFGSSLLLANSPMSPKVVNGSFAAIFDADEILAKAYAGIRATHQNSPAMRRRVKGILMSGKQFSLDSRMDLYGIDTNSTSQDNKNKGYDGISSDCTIGENKSITEDIEDTWEVYEHSNNQPAICAVNHKKRSQSMEGFVPVQNKIYSNKMQASCHSEKTFGLSSYKNCEKTCSLERTYRRRSFNSSLHSIDETESSDFHRSRKRELRTSNYYPEKRQSDPLLQCAFTNKGFYAEVNKAKKNHERFYVDSLDSILHLPSETVEYKRRYIYPIPKVKVRISDECGNRIDNSLDSQSDPEIDAYWDFGGSRINKEYGGGDDDAFSIIQNEEIVHPVSNKCKKCGHKLLKTFN
ncbi:Histidine decarboxylase, partial [Pseudolycoriella hygida]